MEARIHPMKCDIILPVCDQYEFTKNCIESIIKNTDTPFRLIVINNGKNPDTKKLLLELEKNRNVETRIIHNDYNIGWVKALNMGMEISDAPFICFQNDDTIVTKGWLRKMIDILYADPRNGLINPEWEGRANNVSIDDFNAKLESLNRTRPSIETDWCRGFSVVLKKEVYEKIGAVDERYGLAYFDDVDYSVTAIEAGFLCLKAVNTYVYHHRNVTFFQVLKGKKWNELHEKNKIVYYKKWGRPLRIDIIAGGPSDGAADDVAVLAFYLARKQHRVYIWGSDRGLASKIQHTNIFVKLVPGFILAPAVILDIWVNSTKKKEKRYDGVFFLTDGLLRRVPVSLKKKINMYCPEKKSFVRSAEKTTDALKEATKNDYR